ncbi:MAG: sel1 repeat family protein [Methylobacteriaceae bacterium]|nr:sel1 repeat family protein [Methylobacteriaceae bacterium]
MARLLEHAGRGDIDAQVEAGCRYYIGKDVFPDARAAFYWLEMAGEHNHARAQFMVANMLFFGVGVPRDKTGAGEWFKRSAEQGYTGAHAHYELAVMYERGLRAVHDDAEAVKWYRLAAEQGHAKAMWALARKYHMGDGVPKDKAEADKWSDLAAEAEKQQGIEKTRQRK